MPTLALKILEHRTKENKEIAPWSLKGFALGIKKTNGLVLSLVRR